MRVTHSNGALATKDLERVVVDTTVQPKAIAHPTDVRLTQKSIEKPIGFAAEDGIKLRQSYVRVAEVATIMVWPYLHAQQHKRPSVKLRFLRIRSDWVSPRRCFAATVPPLR
jgi:transposase, IS5 family